MSRPAAPGFTLIELLVVIGIMGLLIATSIPAFNSINKGSSMRTAERQLQAGTFLARQQAVTARQRIVFCIPTQIASANGYVRSNMLFRSFLMFAEETPGVARPGSVVGKVETLSKGVVFTNNFSAPWKDYTITDTNNVVLFYGKGFRYASTGSIYWKDAGTYRMILQEGDVPEGASTPRYYPGGIVSTSEVNAITGRIKR